MAKGDGFELVRVNHDGEFGAWLTRAMDAAGTTSEHLKQPPMITGGYIRMLRQGKRNPSLRSVETLLELLDWTVTKHPESEAGPVEAEPSPAARSAGMTAVRMSRPRVGRERKPTAAPSESDAARTLAALSKWAYTARLGAALVGGVRVSLRASRGTRYLRIRWPDESKETIRSGKQLWQECGLEQHWDQLVTAFQPYRLRDGIEHIPPGLWPLIEATRPDLIPPPNTPEMPDDDPAYGILREIIAAAARQRSRRRAN